MQRVLPFSLLLLPAALVVMCGALTAHAQEIPVEEHPAISPEAQKLGGKFLPLNKQNAPMKIVRGSETTPFIPMPDQHNDGRMIPLQKEKYYKLPARPTGPLITYPRPATQNVDTTSVNTDAIRKQQILDAAGKLPTSARGATPQALPDTHGVKVTHGVEPRSAGEKGIAAPSKTVQTAPYGSKLQSSSAPKGASVIDQNLRESAAQRAAKAGGSADPLDVLMQSAPVRK